MLGLYIGDFQVVTIGSFGLYVYGLAPSPAKAICCGITGRGAIPRDAGLRGYDAGYECRWKVGIAGGGGLTVSRKLLLALCLGRAGFSVYWGFASVEGLPK